MFHCGRVYCCHQCDHVGALRVLLAPHTMSVWAAFDSPCMLFLLCAACIADSHAPGTFCTVHNYLSEQLHCPI